MRNHASIRAIAACRQAALHYCQMLYISQTGEGLVPSLYSSNLHKAGISRA